MSRRIEVELTSSRDDGSWTWRAAGAREPKGVVDGALLYPGAKVGDVVRADAEFEIDGITITAVHPPQKKADDTSGRIELLPREFTPVTTSLAPRGRDRRDRRDRSDRERRGPRADRPDRGDRTDRGRRPEGGRAGAGGERRADRQARPRPERAPTDAAKRAPERRDRRRRLTPGRAHRDAFVQNLPAEQQPIAEQLFRGGLPAVRRAVDEQNARAKAEGRPEVNPDGLISIAEQLLPGVRSAEWRDRAEAAASQLDDLALRDLRSVVAGADVARDDESRALATRLREALDQRVTKLRENWLAELTKALDDGKIQKALALSARPADPATRFPGDLAVKLGEAASKALAPDTPAREWASLLDAVADSPVRRAVKPVGLPRDAGEDVIQRAHRLAGRVPALASLLGIDMPPPPGPVRPARPRPGSNTQKPKRPQQPAEGSTSTPTPTPTPTPERPPTPVPDPVPERPPGPGPVPTPERPPGPGPTPERPTPVPPPAPQPPPVPERPPTPPPQPTPQPPAPQPPAPQPDPVAETETQPAPPPPVSNPEAASEPPNESS